MIITMSFFSKSSVKIKIFSFHATNAKPVSCLGSASVKLRFRDGLGPVHTNPFSNENRAVLLRIRLSATLKRRKRSPKNGEPFENAFQSRGICKRCFLKTLFSSLDGETMLSENGDVIKIDTTGRQTTRP